jgi:ATP adenylyltransferase
MEYVQKPPEEEGCLFCNLLAGTDGPGNLVVHRAPSAFVVLNRYPYTNGHMLIAPNAHQPSLEDLESPVLQELMLLLQQSLRILRAEYGARAFNLGSNIGEAAGAGIADHVHLHVLPRWPGDTNFLATTADTRVLPETLDQTYHRLARAWKSSLPGRASLPVTVRPESSNLAAASSVESGP